MLPKKEPLGFSVYLSSFEEQKQLLEENAGTGALLFLSLHIVEEFSDEYAKKIEDLCQQLTCWSYRIIADVSPNTSKAFGESDLIHLAKRLNIWALRLDFGFSEDEIVAMASSMPIVLNASTVAPELAKKAVLQGNPVMAMHNFYPRSETGLDEKYYLKTTENLRALGLQVLSFIPGDTILRGPLFETLPTLEKHRHQMPSIAYVDLVKNYPTDAVFVGDPGISTLEQHRIKRWNEEGILEIPAKLDGIYQKLYGQVFTSRIDSPYSLIRFEEARFTPLFGTEIKPHTCYPRNRGMITIDNKDYGRYCGEIQLMREDFPLDERVNCIGEIHFPYLDAIDLVENGHRFVLVKE